MMDTNDSKTSLLRQLEGKDRNQLIGYDFRVSLFFSALHSYRCDSVLKPFPNQYINEENNEKQFDFLKSELKSIPSLHLLNNEYEMSDNCWKLLDWIINFGSLELIRRPIDSQEISNILNENQLSVKNFKPSFVLQIVSQPKRSFCLAKERFGTFWAFHGSAVENYHSIVHNGLVNCLNKRALFGSGTYLSSQLSVAIEFSPFGLGWNKSSFGREFSCVAVCEVIKHPDIMSQNSSNSVPNAYYVVRNDDLINVSYILVYCKKRNMNNQNQHLIASKLFKHKSSIVFISLVFLLIAIGFKYS